EDARLEAEILVCRAVGFDDRLRIYLEPERLMNEVERSRYIALIAERSKRMPLAYIIGEWEFYGLPFFVNEDVFVPRPATEHLVDAVLSYVKTHTTQDSNGWINVLDVGTGSGCIGVSLAVSDGRIRVVATDISFKALLVAKENAKRHKVGARVRFVLTNILDGIRGEAKFDVVVSNPPYVTEEEYKSVPPEVRYEPVTALYGGGDGMDVYCPLIMRSSVLLKKSGLLALELNPNTAKDIEGFVSRAGFSEIRILPDYGSLPRILLAKK
ncbi:MAG: peptide chain release factor N(5)-glutamine methyltransferase, partial [Planctomycetota bacterium]|nr:peptide chain release factor N(5)-glutamine methyltransferase [Planctomycetota bacterium]